MTAGERRPAAPGPARPTADLTSWTSLFTALEGWTMALLGAPRPAAPRPEPVSPPVAAAELPHPAPGAPSAAPEAPPPAPEASSAADGATPPSPAEPRPLPHLSHHERDAFREIARALGARYEGDSPAPAAPLPPEPPAPGAEAGPSAPPDPPAEVTRLLDRLPIGVLVHRGEEPLYANRALLDLTGHDSVGALAEGGGVGILFPDRAAPGGPEGGAPVLLRDARRGSVAVDVRLAAAEWDGRPAGLMVVRRAPEAETAQRLREAELELRARDARLQEITSILDTAADGVIVLDEAGRILSLNRSAEALFGYDQNEVVGESLGVLLTPESRRVALDYLEGIRRGGVASVLNDGRDVVGRVAQGGSVPLQMTLGRVSASGEHRYCAVLRDATAARRLEAELAAAKRGAEAATRQRADVLARISHEVRTPLNAIMGFAEVMLEERGPDRAAGSSAALADRHADYLRDIRESGRHVIRVVDDLLDLARIEAGQMDMAFTGVPLTEVVMEAIAPLQAAAAARRVVIRTGLSPRLPPVVADARSLTQIVHNLVSNAIRFTEPGGQVIVSTALTETGGVVFRTRDTGVGMTAEEIEAALEPFRAAATARRGGVGLGTGLGLPLTRALVEANRGSLHIVSAKNQGTLVEVVFPPTRVLVE